MALNLDDLKGHFNTGLGGSSSSDKETFQPDDGETLIRLLPPWDKLSNKLFKKVGYHTIEGMNRLLCPREIDNQPCPICEVVFKLYKSKNEQDIVKAKDWRAVRRFFWNIIVRNDEGSGVQKFGCGIKLAQRINDIIFKELGKDITDPDNGHDIMLVKQKIGDFPDYSRSYPIHKPSPLGNLAWLQELHDLDRDFVPRSYAELKEIIENQLHPTTVAVTTTVHEITQPQVTQPQVTKPAETPTPVETKVETPTHVETKTIAQPTVTTEEKTIKPETSLSPDDILKMLNA
jgi:hypothetical protein